MQSARDILAWLQAVLNNWAGYSTGGLVVAVIGFWQVCADKPMLRGTGLALSGLFLIMASFKAWKELLDKNRELHLNFQTLSSKAEQEATKSERQKLINDALGLYLRDIESRILHLKLMESYKFDDAAMEKNLSEWTERFSEIKNFLQQNLSEAEAAYFESTSDMKRTPVPNEDGLLVQRRINHQRVLDNMTHRSSRLQFIIQKRM
ncbi:MAG: hypothetical protein JWR69_2332 [Pedosphaera sp.]|nr:hypothetical protein [Pedosphaera sp.]